MYEKLDEQKLKTGETLEIGVVTAPDDAHMAGVEDLLGHKGGAWQEHIHRALTGDTDALETRFYLGTLGGHPVANIMTVERRGVGILGHVFTRPEQRRKGICQAVMARQMDHFRARDGHVLLLGTGFESPPYWIYHSFGFRSLAGGFMRYAVEPDYAFDARWFAPGPARVVPAVWEHWPLVALVAAEPAPDFLRSAAWGVYGRGNLEGPYVSFLARRAQDDALRAVMLETETGAVAGCATLMPLSPWPGVQQVDVFTHPNYADRTADLVNALDAPAGARLAAWVDTGAADKAAALEACGFAREGALRGFLRAGDTARDVWIYGKGG